MSEMARRVLAAMGWRVIESDDWLSTPDGDVKIPVWSLWQPDGTEQPALYDTPADAWAAAPDLDNDANACLKALDATGCGWRMTSYRKYGDVPAHYVVTIYIKDADGDIYFFKRGATPCEAMLKALAAWYGVEVTDANA